MVAQRVDLQEAFEAYDGLGAHVVCGCAGHLPDFFWLLFPRPSPTIHRSTAIADRWQAVSYRVQPRRVPTRHLRELIQGHDHRKEFMM